MNLIPPLPASPSLPDHTQLPDSDGAIVENFQEHPQSILLTESLWPVLQQLHPDGQFTVGQNSGIYWRITDPPLRGCLAPDWFYVPDVPPMLRGKVRRSYVMWQELESPQIAIEFASGDGSLERDRTPEEGKFWIYERHIRAGFYAIYEFDPGRVEVWRMAGNAYELVAANERGHYPIAPMGIELGIWGGSYRGVYLPWLRCWDEQGQLLPSDDERADEERRRADEERQRIKEANRRADQERRRADQERQRTEEANRRADEERRRTEEANRRADEDRRRAEDERQRTEEANRRADEANQRADEERRHVERLTERLRQLGQNLDEV